MNFHIRTYIFIILIFLIFSCGPGNESKYCNVLRYNESQNISTLDPAFARNQVIIRPVMQVFNGLVQMDDSLNIKPCIAKYWNISANGKEYHFTLRNDVFFHDHPIFPNGKGRKVIASDFVYSFNRILNEKTASPGSWIFNSVKKSNHLTQNGFESTNDTTLTIYLERPFPAFLGVLTMAYASVVPVEIVNSNPNGFGQNPVGTGPFMFKAWQKSQKLVLVKNPNYFEVDIQGNKLPYLDAINIFMISDKQSEFMEFMNGRLDIMIGVNASLKDELIDHEGEMQKGFENKFRMIKGPFLNTEYLAFLVDSSLQMNKALLNPSVRKAINHGIDREKMIRYLRNNIGKPATKGFVPLGMPDYTTEEIQGYDYNPELVYQLLKEAGFEKGQGIEPIILYTTSDYLDLCEYIQHELDQFGIKIEIEISNGATFKEMVANSKVGFFRASWVADYADPENYLSLFYSKNKSPLGPNTTHYSSFIYDSLYNSAKESTSTKERLYKYRQMEDLIHQNAIVVPLIYDETLIFISKKIDIFYTNPLNTLNLKVVNLNCY